MGPRGFEPLTPVLSGLCSNQLSYGPEIKCLPAGRQVSCLRTSMHDALIHHEYTKYQKPSHIDWDTPLATVLIVPFDARLSANKNLLVANFYWRELLKYNNWMPSLRINSLTPSFSNNSSLNKIIRKEVIQPHLPVRLPCYDLAPVTSLTLGPINRDFRYYQLPSLDGRCVQGPGTYSRRRSWSAITSDSDFMESSCRLQSELSRLFCD